MVLTAADHSVAKEHYKYAINLANTHLKQETINLGQVYGVHIMTWFAIHIRERARVGLRIFINLAPAINYGCDEAAA
jgi:serine acetyltransferase